MGMSLSDWIPGRLSILNSAALCLAHAAITSTDCASGSPVAIPTASSAFPAAKTGEIPGRVSPDQRLARPFLFAGHIAPGLFGSAVCEPSAAWPSILWGSDLGEPP